MNDTKLVGYSLFNLNRTVILTELCTQQQIATYIMYYLPLKEWENVKSENNYGIISNEEAPGMFESI